jgi:DNA-binding NarL/FixJ family response regulator
MSVIRILLADDHTLFREGLAGLLDAQPDLKVVGQAGDGLEALVMARRLKPDLILMDIAMPGADGVEATAWIKAELPQTIIVMLTVRDEDEKLFEAIKSGAQGYLLKNIRSRQLINMVRNAMQGQAVITPALSGRMLEEFRRLSRRAPRPPDEPVTALTPREQEVLALVAEGASDQEIANRLTISIHTVKSHMRNILAKLHLGHRHEAARFALQEGLIQPAPNSGAPNHAAKASPENRPD